MRPLPHSAHRTFVETEGWTKRGTARRRGATGDHHRYMLTLATGDVLSTRVSHGAGQINDPGLIAYILRDQLAVTEVDFWNCVDGGILPPRPHPTPSAPAGPVLDAKLVRNLLTKVRLSQQVISTMTREEAVQRWQDWLTGREGSGR